MLPYWHLQSPVYLCFDDFCSGFWYPPPPPPHTHTTNTHNTNTHEIKRTNKIKEMLSNLRSRDETASWCNKGLKWSPISQVVRVINNTNTASVHSSKPQQRDKEKRPANWAARRQDMTTVAHLFLILRGDHWICSNRCSCTWRLKHGQDKLKHFHTCPPPW